MTSKTALHLLALPEEHLPQIISYLTLNDVCQLRLVSTFLRETRHVHHLWMDEEGENSHNITRGRGIMTSRRLQRMLSIFTNITSLRLYGLQLLCRPAVTLSRHYLEVLQNSACAQNLECLELLGVFDCDPECNAYTIDRGTGSTPSYRGHADVCFPKLKRLAIGGVCHEDPQLIRSMLRSSNQQRLGGTFPNMHDFDIEIANIQCHGNTLHDIAKITFVLQEGSNRNGNCVEAAFHSLLLDYTIHHELCGIVANHIVGLDNLNGISPQSLSSIVWAFTKVRLPHRELFVQIGDHIVNLQNLNEFNPEHLSNTLWAFAGSGITHHQLFRKIIGYTLGKES
mmetsp:Transcript_8039/g.13692  ORF Transcript_8039/g.13692 Transcript_8039/m.13692 type:complete len:340 (+) Transcript_8039:89-1108(+)